MTDFLSVNDPDNKMNPHDEQYAMTGYYSPNTMDKATTMTAFMTYHQSCINEIVGQGQYPHSEGMTEFALSLVVADIVRRARLAGLPWEHLLNHTVNQIHDIGHSVTGTECQARFIHPEEE